MAGTVQQSTNGAAQAANDKSGALSPASNTDKDKKIVAFVKEEFERYEAFHQQRFQEAEKDYDNWIGKPPKRAYDWQNQVHVPITFEGEQTITPRIFTALFPSDAPLDVQVEGDASVEQGVKIKNLIQHFFRVTDVQGEAVPTLGQNTLYGTGYLEGGSWTVRRGWQMDANGNRYYTIIESRPDCRHVDFFEMFPHPAKLRMDDGLPLIRRRFVDGEAMKSMAENPYFKFENIQAAIDSKLELNQTGSVMHYKPRPGEKYELLDYWGPYDDEVSLDGSLVQRKQVPYWIIVVNRKIKIRCVPNPFNHQMPPFIKTKLYEDAQPSWFGVGIGKIGRPSQERLNKIVNSRLDNVDLVINKQGFYNGNDPLININKLLVSKPGAWHKVSDTTLSIRWMDTPDVTQSSYLEEERAKADFREATGAMSSLMPADKIDDQHRTALGIQLLQGAAGMRFRPVLRRLEKDLIQQLAMFYFSNLNQFMAEDEWVMVTGEQGEAKPVSVKPEDIQAKVFFIPTGISETLNKEVQVGQLMRFKELTMNDPTVNRGEINRRVAELLGFKDISKLIVSQPSPDPNAGLPVEAQENIRRRLAEGASPEQVKMEMLGPRPSANPA